MTTIFLIIKYKKIKVCFIAFNNLPKMGNLFLKKSMEYCEFFVNL